MRPGTANAYFGEMRNAICLTILLAAATAAADGKPTSINGQLVDTYTGFTIDGADVFVTGPHGLQATVATDATGHYLASVDGPGTYYLTFASGDRRIGYKVEVADGGSTHFDAKLDRGEVIEIHDIPLHRPPIMPVPVQRIPLLPAYSDTMIEHDTWVKAWLLLDIDERGSVARAKFLNRPGHDLDQIAIDHALALKFSPAYDGLGHPMRTLIIYPIEWPSYWWLVATNSGMTVRLPSRQSVLHQPCPGTGPLHLGSVHPVYRDCSKPDLSHLDSEPWFSVPGVAAR